MPGIVNNFPYLHLDIVVINSAHGSNYLAKEEFPMQFEFRGSTRTNG